MQSFKDAKAWRRKNVGCWVLCSASFSCAWWHLWPPALQLSLETRRLMSPLFFSSGVIAKRHNSALKPAVKKTKTIVISSPRRQPSLVHCSFVPLISQLWLQQNKSCADGALMGTPDPEKWGISRCQGLKQEQGAEGQLSVWLREECRCVDWR